MTEFITLDTVGNILTIGLNRPEKKNAVNADMFRGLAAAYTHLCDDPNLRCGVLYSAAELFTSGLDLMDMAPLIMSGGDAQLVAPDQVDPFNWGSVAGKQGRLRSKPVITAINGKCFTAGIELALSTDIIVADETAVFAQAEIRRGLTPLGGAVERFTTRFGWGNAMRWLLTGDSFDVHEAHRIGLVQEIAPDGKAFDRAMEIAERVASAAPLGVEATLANAQTAIPEGAQAAADALRPQVERVRTSSDLQEGIASMFQKRDPVFKGS